MDRLFNVHPGNGSVFLLKSLDREETAWHNISIIATEFSKSSGGAGGGRLFEEMMGFIDVNHRCIEVEKVSAYHDTSVNDKTLEY